MLRRNSKTRTRSLAWLLTLTVTCITLLSSFAGFSVAAEETDPVNLAYGKTVKASSSFDQYSGPEKAVDADTSSMSNWTVVIDDGSEWMIVDLGTPTEIGRYTVRHHSSSLYATHGFQVQYSTDAGAWDAPDSATWVTVDTVTGNTASVTNQEVDTFTAQYVRLVVTDPCDPSVGNAARIFEFELYAPSGTELLNPNFALNATISASGDTGNPAEAASSAVDENPTTVWCKDGNRAAYSEWLMVDFGQTREIGRYVVKHFGAGRAGVEAYNTRDFKLQYSATGEGDWVTVDTVTGNTDNVTDQEVDTFTAQYVRLLITDPCDSSVGNALRIAEFELYAPIDPSLEDPNVALNKKVTASGDTGNPAEAASSAVDGNPATVWCKDGNRAAYNEWLMVDLGRTREIGRYVVKHFGNESYNTRDFKVQYSVSGNPDGIWMDVDTVAGNTAHITDREVEPFKARYVRLLITDPCDPSVQNALRIGEFELYAPTEPEEENPNFAMNKPASHSHAQPNEDASKAVDGNTGTHWCAVGTDRESYSEWLMVDLGKEKVIGHYVVRHHGAEAYNTRDFQLQYSTTGTGDWVTADTVTGNTENITSKEIEPFTAQYVRLLVTYSCQADLATRIKEFELYAPGTKNVALSRVTGCSYAQPSEPSSHAVDGNLNSYWTSIAMASTELASFNEWLMVDLGAEMTLGRYVVKHYGAVRSGAERYNTRDFKVQYSVTGDGGWIDVDTVTGNTDNITDKKVTPFTARYVRLLITTPCSSGDGNVAARIGEFELYGQIPEPVDKTALKELITQAMAAGEETDSYPEGSLASLMQALENAGAVVRSERSTQEDINAAFTALQKAIDGLTAEPVDKTVLNGLIAGVESSAGDQDKYTETSLAALMQAYNAAKDVAANNEATQQMVDDAAAALQKAIDELELKPVAKSVTVIFIGKQDAVIAEKTAASAAELTNLLNTVKAPALGGYVCVGWDNSPEDMQAWYDNAQAGDVLTVNAVYEVDEDTTYTISVTDATATRTEGLTFDSRVTVTATGDTTPSYWVLDGAKVGFRQKEYTFYVSGENEIQPMYDSLDAVAEVTLQQAIGSSEAGVFNLAVVAQTSVWGNANVSEFGVIYAASAADLLDGPSITVVSSKNMNQQYMTNLLNVSADKYRYAVAYMVVDGKTVYSTKAVQFHTNTDGTTTIVYKEGWNA